MMKFTFSLLAYVLLFLSSGMAQSDTIDLAKDFKSLFKKKDYQQAITVGEKWKESVYRNGITKTDSARVANILMDLGSSYNSTLQLRKAEAALEEALAIMPKDSINYGSVLSAVGNVKVGLGIYQEADSILQEAMRWFKNHHLENGRGFNACLINIASLQHEQGFIDLSYNQYQKALAHWNINKLQGASLGRIYNGLYQVMAAQGNYTKAADWLDKAIETLSQYYPADGEVIMGRKKLYAIVLMNNGRLDEAEPYLEALMKQIEAKRGTNTLEYARAMCVMTCIDQQLGKIDDALELTAKQEPILMAAFGATHSETIENRINRVALLLDAGRKEEAKLLTQVIQESLDTAKNKDFLTMARVYSIRAKCEENAEKALEFCKKAFERIAEFSGKTNGGDNANIVLLLARDYLKFGQLEEAGKIFQSFDDSEWAGRTSHNGYRQLLFTRGLYYALIEKPHSAVQDWKHLTDIFRNVLSDELFLLNDYQRIDRLNRLRDLSNLLLTHAQNKTLQDEGLLSVALDFQLYKKSILLSAAQTIREKIQADSSLAPAFAQWTDVREKLAWCYTQGAGTLEKQKVNVPLIQARADSLENIIARNSSAFASERLNKPFSWRELQKRLLPGEAAIEITVFRKYEREQTDTVQYAFFIVRPDLNEPAMFVLDNGEQIDQTLLEKYLVECADVNGKGKTGELYKSIWQKLEPYLKDISRLYISADGVFYKINVGAIQLPDGRYVADRYDVRSVFSLKEIHHEDTLTGNAKLTAFLAGNPSFLLKEEATLSAGTMRSVIETTDSSNFLSPLQRMLRNAGETRGTVLSPLPGSEREVNDIARVLHKKEVQTTVVSGLKATEESVKSLKSPTILHLATHGYFLANVRSGTAGISRSVLESNPMMRSMIFFVGAQNTLDKKPVGSEDGILTAYEVQNLHLEGTELAVLSACKTAQGKIQNGEGVYGLQRALRIAGAKAVILSLWDIDDRIGREFMILFYEKWLGGMKKAQAFRAAQLDIKKKYPQPFYWAGFVLIGE